MYCGDLLDNIIIRPYNFYLSLQISGPYVSNRNDRLCLNTFLLTNINWYGKESENVYRLYCLLEKRLFHLFFYKLRFMSLVWAFIRFAVSGGK